MLQAEILKSLRQNGDGVTVVGDDAQAIYSFRAATVDNILGFPDQYIRDNGLAASVITLEENYRSTQGVLDAANALIAESDAAVPKGSADDAGRRPSAALCHCRRRPGAGRICRARVLATRESGVPLKRQAVLFRSSHHSDTLELELTRRNIPFVKYGGLKFLEAAHVKDLLACCGGPTTRRTASPHFARCNCCRVWAPPPPNSSSTRFERSGYSVDCVQGRSSRPLAVAMRGIHLPS